ncbi:MAG: NAD-dependent epimerase/dehydratase family protein [Spirochaetales bacterium]|nr:NAD-dependent epimerase/dehydratase family protein [Spirochaetales bacterium]
MKILYIGGTGNISRHSSLLAISQGHQLTHINRGMGEPVAGTESLKADVNDVAAMKKIIQGRNWDVVVNWILFTPGQAKANIELFTGKCGQFIFISSASVYEKPPRLPIITESTPLLNPFWDYSRDKIACEELFNRAYVEKGFPVTILRPSLTYDRVIPAAIACWKDYTLIDRIKQNKEIVVHGDGNSLWTITHARDFAKGFNGLLGHPLAIGQSFHITSHEILTWNQIYDAMAAAVGKRARKVYIPSVKIAEAEASTRGTLLGDKSYSAIFDNSKIRQLVPDFYATTPFWKGIEETISWYEADPKRQVILPENNALLDRLIKLA